MSQARPADQPDSLAILMIEDNEDDALLLLRRFKVAGYRVDSERVFTAATMRSALDQREWDLIISDHSMPGFDALAALDIIKARGLDVPFIIASGHIDEDTAISAMRAGAHDYLNKNNLERLLPAIERELREARNRRERRQALATLQESEARLRSLAASTPGVIFQMRRCPECGLRFTYASDACEMLLGLGPEALMADAKRFSSLLLDTDRGGFTAAVEESAREGVKLNWEGRIVTPQQDIKWINLRASLRTQENGRPVWEGVMWNITHSKRVEEELRASQRQLAALSNHLQHVKEEERERIARDVHDVLGGDLVAMKFETALRASRLDGPREGIEARVKSISALVDEAIATVSRVTRELRPGILRDFGLAAAIEGQAEDFSGRTGTPCEVLCSDYDIELPDETSIAVFRIFQEALTNISKHAGASRVDVRLMQEGDELLLEISDDGKGIAPKDLNKPKSFGLRGIRERIASLGGTLSLDSAGKRGTHLQLRLPLGDQQHKTNTQSEVRP